MLIAQITDLHLGFDPGNPAELNRQRLDAVLARLMAMRPRPDLIVATGDLTEFGDDASYRALVAALGSLDIPVLPCLGNHDRRAAFAANFPHVPTDGGFVQYVHDAGPLRLVMTDTLDEARHGGAFCEARAGWLAARLDEAREQPAVVVVHHPPIPLGIEWMDPAAEEAWAARLRRSIEGRSNVVAVLCGHIHRPTVARWAGTALVVCPSTAPQVALDLSPIDAERPDGRAMIVADPPAFALHWWNGRQLVSHFETAGEHPVLAKFDGAMQPLIRGLVAERER